MGLNGAIHLSRGVAKVDDRDGPVSVDPHRHRGTRHLVRPRRRERPIRHPGRSTAAGPDTDVVVVGGGPAGAAAALMLARYSKRRVILIERNIEAPWRPGETLPPGVQPLLEYLGAWPGVGADGNLPDWATSAAWGGLSMLSRQHLRTGPGPGWHVDRNRFDSALLDAAQDRGVELVRGRPAVGAGPLGTGWQVLLADGDVVSGRHVIDASGRAAVVARAAGARVHRADALVGVTGVLACSEAAGAAGESRVAAVPEGWWYVDSLADGGVLATLMTDAPLVRAARYDRPECWRRSLVGSGLVSPAWVADSPLRCRLAIRTAASQQLDPPAGEGWTAAGEAAAAFDPLAAMGVGIALASGIEAARVADAALRGEPAQTVGYRLQLAAVHTRYLTLLSANYGQERRWPDAPFWFRRRAGGA